jgi:hypothetical protein
VPAYSPLPWCERKIASAENIHATEAAMPRLFSSIRDNGTDVLLIMAASAYVLGFLVAVELALARLVY